MWTCRTYMQHSTCCHYTQFWQRCTHRHTHTGICLIRNVTFVIWEQTNHYRLQFKSSSRKEGQPSLRTLFLIIITEQITVLFPRHVLKLRITSKNDNTFYKPFHLYVSFVISPKTSTSRTAPSCFCTLQAGEVGSRPWNWVNWVLFGKEKKKKLDTSCKTACTTRRWGEKGRCCKEQRSSFSGEDSFR